MICASCKRDNPNVLFYEDLLDELRIKFIKSASGIESFEEKDMNVMHPLMKWAENDTSSNLECSICATEL